MPDRFQAPRGVADLLPEDQPYWRWLRETADPRRRVLRLRRDPDARLRARRRLPAPRRRGHRHRRQGDLPLPGPRRRRPGAAPGRHGRRLPRLPRARHGVAAAAGAPLLHRRPSSATTGPRPDATASTTSSASKRSATASPAIDAEVIDLLRTLLRRAGPDATTPAAQQHRRRRSAARPTSRSCAPTTPTSSTSMCGDCRRRYDINPLRLLDCKNEPCQPFKAGAPKIVDNLCEPCERALRHREAPARRPRHRATTIDHALVRGLDYYTRTAFEFQPDGRGLSRARSAAAAATTA